MILMNKGGWAYETFTPEDAERIAEQLRAAFGCKVKVVKDEKIVSDVWRVLDFPKHFHASARVFIAGYKAGSKDGRDSYAGRKLEPLGVLLHDLDRIPGQ